MIEKITVALVGENGDIVPLKNHHVTLKIETAIADTFTEICFRNNSITDAETQTAEKFAFAVALNNYLKEIKQNAD